MFQRYKSLSAIEQTGVQQGLARYSHWSDDDDNDERGDGGDDGYGDMDER